MAELLARLAAATALGDDRAAARIVDDLGDTEQGAWLVRHFCAAGLRRIGADLVRE